MPNPIALPTRFALAVAVTRIHQPLGVLIHLRPQAFDLLRLELRPELSPALRACAERDLPAGSILPDGKSWSIETWGGWSRVMSRYRAAMANTRTPHLVGFNVHGDPTDYRFFRYAYASCLLEDGYFCFTAKDKEYSSVTWFDEFDFKLGAATTQPPTGPWQSGVWRRDFEHGIALVNPTKEAVTVTLDPGFCRLKPKQDPATNDGSPATSIMLPARDGIILCRQVGQHHSGGQPLSEKEYLR